MSALKEQKCDMTQCVQVRVRIGVGGLSSRAGEHIGAGTKARIPHYRQRDGPSRRSPVTGIRKSENITHMRWAALVRARFYYIKTHKSCGAMKSHTSVWHLEPPPTILALLESKGGTEGRSKRGAPHEHRRTRRLSS